MAILKVYVAPHPVLKTVAEPVEEITDETRKLAEDMLDTMYTYDGIGLAAPKVGISQRILVIDLEQDLEQDDPLNRRGNPYVFINPEITYESEETRVYQEGCLSLPDQYADVERPETVKVKYTDLDGNEQNLDGNELMATAVQHEMDHLNGILFVDHLSKLKRDMVMKKLKKFVKNHDLSESHVTE